MTNGDRDVAICKPHGPGPGQSAVGNAVSSLIPDAQINGSWGGGGADTIRSAQVGAGDHRNDPPSHRLNWRERRRPNVSFPPKSRDKRVERVQVTIATLRRTPPMNQGAPSIVVHVTSSMPPPKAGRRFSSAAATMRSCGVWPSVLSGWRPAGHARHSTSRNGRECSAT